MSYNTLQKNLQYLIEKNNYQIADLERKAGLKKNNIYNIVKGISKKPSAELLQAVADILQVSVKDLFSDNIPQVEKSVLLTDKELSLLLEVTQMVIEEVMRLKLQITHLEIINIINQTYEISSSIDPTEKLEVDRKVIKWLLAQKFLDKKLN